MKPPVSCITTHTCYLGSEPIVSVQHYGKCGKFSVLVEEQEFYEVKANSTLCNGLTWLVKGPSYTELFFAVSPLDHNSMRYQVSTFF